MSRRAIVALSVVALLFVALLIAGSFVSNANVIDDKAWRGDPVPPCFVNATLCGGHVLGTDEVGRDLLARLVVGARTSLGSSFLAAVFTFLFAVALAAAARFGGPIVKYIVTCLSVGVSSLPAWPFLVVLIVVGGNARNENWVSSSFVAIVVAAISWPKMTGLLGRTRALVPILDRFLRDWASILLVVSTAAFLGYGMPPPPTSSWGGVLASMEATMQTGWWVPFFPVLCIFGTVFGLRAVARYALSSTSVTTGASGSPTSG